MFANIFPLIYLQQYGKILDVEIIFNERGSKVRAPGGILFSQTMTQILLTVDSDFHFACFFSVNVTLGDVLAGPHN